MEEEINITKNDNNWKKKSYDLNKIWPLDSSGHIQNHRALIFYGKRNTGKSHLLKWIMYHNYKIFSDIYVISPTAEIQSYGAFSYMPKKNIINSYNSDFISNLFEEQKAYKIKYNESRSKTSLRRPKDILVIFDDVISEDGVTTSHPLHKLFTAGRHYNISVIMLTQLIGRNGIPSVLRSNCDFLIAFAAISQLDREKIAEHFLSIKTKKEGISIYLKATNASYEAMLIDNSFVPQEYNEYVYSIMAPKDIPKFRWKPKEYKNEITGQFKIPILSEEKKNIYLW